MSDPLTCRRPLVRARDTPAGFTFEADEDVVAREEPLEIRIDHDGRNVPVAVTMRTPGDDLSLATGFLFTEGIIDGPHDLIEVRSCHAPGAEEGPVPNVVQALLPPDASFDEDRFRRNVYTTSSCGICGKASIDAIEVRCPPLGPIVPRVAAATLSALPDRLRVAQAAFAATGGLHATALVRADGTLVQVHEDVGRHNAMDKVIGDAFRSGRLPLADHILMVSGRVSFELVQKAARAGAPVLVAIGAPSSLALEAAERLGLTVVGFLGRERFNVYTHPGRISGVEDRSAVPPAEGARN